MGRVRLVPRHAGAARARAAGGADLRITFFVVGQDAALDRNETAHPGAAPTPGTRSATTRSGTSRGCTATPDEIHDELRRAEDAIEAVTGRRTVGFRGPGYSLSADVLRVLVDRGYRYDCSTLPTVIGPLARRVLLPLGRADGRAARRAGATSSVASAKALRPLKPYQWEVGAGPAPRDPRHHDAVGSASRCT